MVFIADLIARSKCFGHHYDHHQELKSYTDGCCLLYPVGLLFPRINILCVFVALGIQHAMRMRHNFFYGLIPLCNIFPYCHVKGMIFFLIFEHEICVSSFSTTFV